MRKSDLRHLARPGNVPRSVAFVAGILFHALRPTPRGLRQPPARQGEPLPAREVPRHLEPREGAWRSVQCGVGCGGRLPGPHRAIDGPWVTVQVFESESLADAWQELDAFEGSEYRRVLIPVYSEDPDARLLYSANLYALAR